VLILNIKTLFPNKLKHEIKVFLKKPGKYKVVKNLTLYRLALRQEKIKKRIKYKKKIKVVFLVLHHSTWKYDVLYDLLEKDPRFEPIVIACPVVNFNEEYMYSNLLQTFNYFKENYNVINSLKENGDWLDINEDFQPDLVFFTNPYNITLQLYQIDSFYNSLTCYVPYAFVVIHLLDGHYSSVFHSKLWKHFVETKTHKEFACSYYPERSNNTIVSGYPGLDNVFDKDYAPKSVWKKISIETLKIIWAPHHSIDDDTTQLAMSNFLNYANFFLDYVYKNNNVQIAFKPHPLLKPKLYLHENWGQEKTDDYYRSWELIQNGQLEIGEYVDLFSESDALILDSASFMVEYLYFDKPILFMLRDDKVHERLNKFGKNVLEQLYTSINKEELVSFLSYVNMGKDTKMKERKMFFRNEIKPNKITASENIYNLLKKELG
jgi:hypothetical protein